MIQVRTFSKGKTDDRNEDYFGYNQNCFVIVDGTTDKAGKKYDNKTSGEIVSRIVVNECLNTDLNGVELVNHLNNIIKKLYNKFGILKKTKDPKYRFTCVVICARIVKKNLIVTYLGDLGYRINGSKVYQETIQFGVDCAEKRSKYIRETNDIEGSRKHILPLILEQFKYQNNPRDILGYGVIDGTKTPSKFVKTFEYNVDQIETLELFTDGYFEIPKEVSIEAWEKAYERVEKIDPDKWKKYKATKPKDDRTVAIINF